MKVRFWGVRGSIPSPGEKTVKFGGNTPCVEVETGGPESIILDAGTGIRNLGLSWAGKKGLDIHLFISHTHWDHIQGFPFFVPIYMPHHKLTVYGPLNSMDKSLRDIMTRQMDYSTFPVKLGELQADIEFVELKEEKIEIGETTVESRYLNHPVFTLGYSVVNGGKKVCYQTDHEPYYNLFADDSGDSELNSFIGEMNGKIVEFGKGSDLLIADTMYAPNEYETHRGWGHSSAAHVVERAVKGECRRLAIFHHEPNHSDEFLEEMLEKAREHARSLGSDLEVLLAREGEELEF